MVPLAHFRLPRSVRAIVALLAFAVGTIAGTAQADLTLMHGFADYTSALLWIQTARPASVDVVWTVEGEGASRKLQLQTSAAEENATVARLTGLVPGKTAHYRVEGDGAVREGDLQAQPWWSTSRDAPEITIAIGSCAFLADADPRWPNANYGGGDEIFDSIAAKRPTAMLWLGDNLYFQPPDLLDPAALAARHRRQRTHPPLARLWTATSHLAIWDDHDYGPNDSDASYTMKGETLRLFKRYWANPSYGLPETPGIFGYARLGDVDLFLLDDRYFRSSNRAKDGPGKTMLGAQQLAWLKAALLASEAPIKLIANGSQVLNRVSRFEGWHWFATEQRAFLAFLREHRIEGVVFLSGDRHFGELLRVERPGAYPLYEFTSSPLTSQPWGVLEARELANRDVVPGTLIGKRQFGMIRVSGPGNDRMIEFSSYDQRGETLWRHEIRASALTFRDGRAPDAR